MFQWSNTARQTNSNLVASQSNHFVFLMVCVAHVCDTMSELEVGNFEAESDAQIAGLFFGSFLLTCMITGPGGIEGRAQLWLTGIHPRDLSPCGLAFLQHDSWFREGMAWEGVPTWKGRSQRQRQELWGFFWTGLWNHEALFCFILLVLREFLKPAQI